jgi:hypothetical protein
MRITIDDFEIDDHKYKTKRLKVKKPIYNNMTRPSSPKEIKQYPMSPR